jgi:hypothetical protein
VDPKTEAANAISAPSVNVENPMADPSYLAIRFQRATFSIFQGPSLPPPTTIRRVRCPTTTIDTEVRKGAFGPLSLIFQLTQSNAFPQISPDSNDRVSDMERCTDQRALSSCDPPHRQDDTDRLLSLQHDIFPPFAKYGSIPSTHLEVDRILQVIRSNNSNSEDCRSNMIRIAGYLLFAAVHIYDANPYPMMDHTMVHRPGFRECILHLRDILTLENSIKMAIGTFTERDIGVLPLVEAKRQHIQLSEAIFIQDVTAFLEANSFDLLHTPCSVPTHTSEYTLFLAALELIETLPGDMLLALGTILPRFFRYDLATSRLGLCAEVTALIGDQGPWKRRRRGTLSIHTLHY